MIRDEKHTVHCQGFYFWGDAQVLGYGRLKKMVKLKETLNKNQRLPCWCWSHVLLFFLQQFMRFVLLLLLHNSGKFAIPHDTMLLLLRILHLILFKLLQRQSELSISGRADLRFVQNRFFMIYFWPSISKSCPPRAAKMKQGLRPYWWHIENPYFIDGLIWVFSMSG